MTADDEAPPRRKYNSTRRRHNAEQTRREILDAARTDEDLAGIEHVVLAEEREQTRLTLLTLLPDPSDLDIEGMQALYSSDLYILLTEIRGWTAEQYVNWISELTLAALTAKGVVQ